MRGQLAGWCMPAPLADGNVGSNRCGVPAAITWTLEDLWQLALNAGGPVSCPVRFRQGHRVFATLELKIPDAVRVGRNY